MNTKQLILETTLKLDKSVMHQELLSVEYTTIFQIKKRYIMKLLKDIL